MATHSTPDPKEDAITTHPAEIKPTLIEAIATVRQTLTNRRGISVKIILLFLALLFVGYSVKGQTLKRESTPLKYTAGDTLFRLSASDFTCWNYSKHTGKWDSTDGKEGMSAQYISCGDAYGDLLDMTIRRIVIDKDTMSLFLIKYQDGYYKYPTIKQDFRIYTATDLFIVDAGDIKEDFEESLQELKESSEPNFTPGVENDFFDLFVDETISGERITPEELNKKIIDRLTESRSISKSFTVPGMAIFPVRVDQKESVRFIFYRKTRTIEYDKYALNGFKDEIFSESYYEMSMEKFKEFLAVLR